MKYFIALGMSLFLLSCKIESPSYQFTNEEVSGGKGKLFVARSVKVENDGELKFTGTPGPKLGTRIKKRDNVRRIMPYNVLTIAPSYAIKSFSETVDTTSSSGRCSITHNARGRPIMIQIELQSCQMVVRQIVQAIEIIGYSQINKKEILIAGHRCLDPKVLDHEMINRQGITSTPFCRLEDTTN